MFACDFRINANVSTLIPICIIPYFHICIYALHKCRYQNVDIYIYDVRIPMISVMRRELSSSCHADYQQTCRCIQIVPAPAAAFSCIQTRIAYKYGQTAGHTFYDNNNIRVNYILLVATTQSKCMSKSRAPPPPYPVLIKVKP